MEDSFWSYHQLFWYLLLTFETYYLWNWARVWELKNTITYNNTEIKHWKELAQVKWNRHHNRNTALPMTANDNKSPPTNTTSGKTLTPFSEVGELTTVRL